MKAVAPLLVLSLLALSAFAGDTFGIISGTDTAYPASSFVRSYPAYNADGTAAGTHSWRVVNGTGNCCENHITASSAGVIYDLGAQRPVFSSDDGASWKRPVLSLAPPQGEGSAVMAPNGDYVGMTWDPYSGDRVYTFKYNASDGRWYGGVLALHSPVYDRPWIGIVNGPIEWNGMTAPYAVLMNGGVGFKTDYISLDGITYFILDTNDIMASQGWNYTWLTQPAVAWADYSHPIREAQVQPLPAGGALFRANCGWATLNETLTPRCHRFPDNTYIPLNATPRFDSQGRLHLFQTNATGFIHRTSTDGGMTFGSTFYRTPVSGVTSHSWDMVVNADLDMAVAAVHVVHGAPSVSKMFVWKIANFSTASPDVRVFQLGKGDRWFEQGVLAGGSRMDFMTIALQPDGRVAASFGDSVHTTPRVAIESNPWGL